MTDDLATKPIRASRETIWHLTCGSCHYYWTYPTMDAAETVEGKTLHCPLCGARAEVEREGEPTPPGGGGA